MKDYYFKSIAEITSDQRNKLFKKFFFKDYFFLKKNWKWKYRINDNQNKKTQPIVLFSKNELLGFAGSQFTELCYKNKVFKSKWFIDFYIDKNFRSKGLGKILTKKWMSDSLVKLTFCNYKSKKIFEKMGWINNMSYFDFRYILNPIKYFLNKFVNLENKNKKFKIFKNKNCFLLNVHQNKSVVIDLFKNIKNNLSYNNFELNRDRNWLNWRVFQSPFFKEYQMIKYKNSFILFHVILTKNTKTLLIKFSYFENKFNKQEIHNFLFNFLEKSNINFIWYVDQESNNTLDLYFKKKFKLNFLYHLPKKFDSKININHLQGIDGDNDLLFYNI